MSFKPYPAPYLNDDCDGTSDNAGQDLCWRINWQDQSETVTPSVLGAVQWALKHFPVTPEQKKEILESLGFEEIELLMGGKVIRPRD